MNAFRYLLPALLLLMPATVPAGDCFLPGGRVSHGHFGHAHVSSRYATGGYGHVKVAAHHDQVQVVNNVVAVPVPVPYVYPVAQQGQTIYGYTSVSQAYGNLDLAVLYDRAERLASQAQQLAGQATTDYSTLVESAGSRRANDAAILAAAQALREVLDASGRNNSASRTVTGTAQAATASTADAVLQSRCASCHDSYRSASDLSAEQWTAVVARITHAEPQKRMPLAADRSSAGEPLTMSEKSLLLRAWYDSQQ